MVNEFNLVLLFLTGMYTAKLPLMCLGKCRQELLSFFVAHDYVTWKGTNEVTVKPVAFYKLSKGWKAVTSA